MKLFVLSVTMSLFLNSFLISQNLNVHDMIGENLDVVIKTFGKPAHQDRANKAMECMFYKTKNYQMVFVANEEGVYQAEGSNSVTSKSSAEGIINDFLKDCKDKGFIIDTLNVSEFNLKKPGVKMNISLFENTFSAKYEVKVKANRSEE